MFFIKINYSHFGRHSGFLGKLQEDSPGLLACYSADFSGPILKMSACYEKVPGFIQCSWTNSFVDISPSDNDARFTPENDTTQRKWTDTYMALHIVVVNCRFLYAHKSVYSRSE